MMGLRLHERHSLKETVLTSNIEDSPHCERDWCSSAGPAGALMFFMPPVTQSWIIERTDQEEQI